MALVAFTDSGELPPLESAHATPHVAPLRQPASKVAAGPTNAADPTHSNAGELVDAAAAGDADPAPTTSPASLDSAVAPARTALDGQSAPSIDASAHQPPSEPHARAADASSAVRAEGAQPELPASLDAERSADVLRQVRLRLSPELRQAVIQLEPRELGRIAIRISVVRGVVRAELRAEQQATLEALERHAPELKAALERVGLATDAFALQLGLGDASSEHGAAEQRPSGGRGREFVAAEPDPPATSAQLRSLSKHLAAAGGVDTYA